MKKIVTLTLALVVLSSGIAQAGERVTINVNGMVCDFCARAVDKVFTKQDGVESVNVDLGAKQIILAMHDGKSIDDQLITKLITDSGYALVDITREADHE